MELKFIYLQLNNLHCALDAQVKWKRNEMKDKQKQMTRLTVCAVKHVFQANCSTNQYQCVPHIVEVLGFKRNLLTF